MEFANEQVNTVLEYTVLNNTVLQWAIAVIAFIVIYFVLRAIRNFFSKQLKKLAAKTPIKVDDLVADMVKSIKGFIILTLALWFATQGLTLPENIRSFIKILPILAFLFQAGVWGNKIILFFLTQYIENQQDEEKQRVSETFMGPIKVVAMIILWALLFLLALDNMGVDVTALVAGLGIGGIAVALAVQNVLGDLLASVSIAIDQPFVVGDFIVVGDHMGNVERIGMKTTRVRSLSGEQLVFSNSDLLSSRIRNYKRMFERRMIFSFGVLYQTEAHHLKEIPTTVKNIIESIDNTRFDRAHFKEFGASSLDFEAVYYVLVPELPIAMDIQQEINIRLFELFAERGIEFAYPTRTLFIDGELPPIKIEGEKKEAKPKKEPSKTTAKKPAAKKTAKED